MPFSVVLYKTITSIFSQSLNLAFSLRDAQNNDKFKAHFAMLPCANGQFMITANGHKSTLPKTGRQNGMHPVCTPVKDKINFTFKLT